MMPLNDLNILASKVYENAKNKGWWTEEGEDRVKLIPEKIALIHSELSEALEEYRNHHEPTEIYYGENGKPEGIPVEIADVIIRCLDFCAGYNIDVDEAMRIKMAYNATRPMKHGNKKI